MIGCEPREVKGHAHWCLVGYGFDDNGPCDCGGKERMAREAEIAACQHEWTGFRDAKVCKRCGVPKRDLKGR